MNPANERLAATKGDLNQGPSLTPWTMETEDTSHLDAAEAAIKLHPKIKLIGSSSSSDEQQYDETNKSSSSDSLNSSYLETNKSSSSDSLNSSYLEIIKPNWLLSQIYGKITTPINMSPVSFSSYDSSFDDGPSIQSIPSSPEAEKKE